MSIPEKLAEIGRLVDKETVENPDYYNTDGAEQFIPNPALLPLLEVVRETGVVKVDIHYKQGETHDWEQEADTPRSWEGKLDGELEGALLKALAVIRRAETEPEAQKRIEAAIDTITLLVLQEGDTREASLDAVLSALKGQRGG